MARFLKTSDYSSIIQTVDLNQITENTTQNLLDAEAKAISRMRTKLVQRYNVDVELGSSDTAYSASTHYRTKQRVLQTTIYSVKEFGFWEKSTSYVVGDIKCNGDGYVYTCIVKNTNVELTNTTYWTPMTNVTYTNTTYWQNVDNRYPLFIEIAMDLTLYNLYARINPRNIPTLRMDRNREALDLLDAWASGTDTAEVLEFRNYEQEGYSIRYGSSTTKSDNFFK
jgi:hypothetical protein